MAALPAFVSWGLALTAAALAACSPPADAPAAAPAPAAPAATAPSPVKVADPPGAWEVRYYVLDPSCPYCRDLRRLIEGGGKDPAPEPPLAKVYEGKVRFVFRPAFDAKFDPSPETKDLGFGGSAHGFAGVAPDGTVRWTSPGHHQTRAEIVEAIDRMLR
jgi:hypothetical protein